MPLVEGRQRRANSRITEGFLLDSTTRVEWGGWSGFLGVTAGLCKVGRSPLKFETRCNAKQFPVDDVEEPLQCSSRMTISSLVEYITLAVLEGQDGLLCMY